MSYTTKEFPSVRINEAWAREEDSMPKTITLYLSTSPYSYENTLTSARIAGSALNKGHTVNLIASADGIYCFLTK